MRISDSIRIELPGGNVERSVGFSRVDGVCTDYWIVFSYFGVVHYYASKHDDSLQPDSYW